MSSSFKFGWLLVMNVTVWGLNFMIYKGTIKLGAKLGIPVTLEIEPSRAKLTVDNKIWDNHDTINGWIQSPATLRLTAGQHKLMLERPGYTPHIFKVLVAEGDNIQMKTVMEAQTDKFFAVEITSDNPDDLEAQIDGGLEVGPLPLRADELLPGQHQLEIRLTGLEGFRSKPLLCQFMILQNGDRVTQLEVTRTGKKLKVTGCKKIKESRQN